MDCERCGHAAKDHCKGNVEHSNWKDEHRQNGLPPRVSMCHTRHCLMPLCSCVDLIEPTKSRALIEGWFDGCTEPINPGGHSAYGIAINVDGQPVCRRGGYVGVGKGMSNNVAEYCGFIAALEEAIKYQGPIVLRGDSLLVVKQISGKWDAHFGAYLPYYEKAKALWGKHSARARVIWIPREKNTICDALSKRVLSDRGIVFRIQPSPVRFDVRKAV